MTSQLRNKAQAEGRALATTPAGAAISRDVEDILRALAPKAPPRVRFFPVPGDLDEELLQRSWGHSLSGDDSTEL